MDTTLRTKNDQVLVMDLGDARIYQSQMSAFPITRQEMAQDLLLTEPFNAGRWQALDVSSSSIHATFELLNVTLRLPMTGSTPESLAIDTRADLPWAEDHFQERVGGEPANPGKAEAYWPYHNGRGELHKRPLIPKTIDERDWAYLAAMIDGDGCIHFKKNPDGSEGRPFITLSQKDHDFIHTLHQRFGFGQVFYRDRDNVKTPDGKIRRSNPAIWRMNGKALALYVLEHIEPYLVLKKSKAQQGIEWLKNAPPHHSDAQFMVETEPIYDHNYMERFWPKYAGHATVPHRGIRFEFGDLQDVVTQLKQDRLTRQAYLPIWHPEDTGATQGQRVPCSLGYHFIVREGRLHLQYNLRSVEVYRHFHNDVYMAVRLAQWVAEQVGVEELGWLTMHMVSFHGFVGDSDRILKIARQS